MNRLHPNPLPDSVHHLVIFDSKCPFCCASVRLLFRLDKWKTFAFSPLVGATAKHLLNDRPELLTDPRTLVLFENFHHPESQLHLYGSAVLRICWLLGGICSLIGWLYFFPSTPANWIYKIIARNRSRIGNHMQCDLSGIDPKRLLP